MVTHSLSHNARNAALAPPLMTLFSYCFFGLWCCHIHDLPIIVFEMAATHEHASSYMELQAAESDDPLSSACAKCCCFCDDLSKYRGGDWTPHLRFVAGVFVFFVFFLIGIISFYTLANADHSTGQYIYLPIGHFPSGIPPPTDALVVELQWNQINPAPAGTDTTARVDFFYPPGEASGFPARPTRSLYFNLGRELYLMQAGGTDAPLWTIPLCGLCCDRWLMLLVGCVLFVWLTLLVGCVACVLFVCVVVQPS